MLSKPLFADHILCFIPQTKTNRHFPYLLTQSIISYCNISLSRRCQVFFRSNYKRIKISAEIKTNSYNKILVINHG